MRMSFDNPKEEKLSKHCSKMTECCFPQWFSQFSQKDKLNHVIHMYNFSFSPFPNKPWFLHVCSTSLLKTLWEKEKLLVMSDFSFFHSVFYPFEELSSVFIKFEIVVCKLFQFGRV